MKILSVQHWLDQVHLISGNCPAHQAANAFLHISRAAFEAGLLLTSYPTLRKCPALQKGWQPLWAGADVQARHVEAHLFCSLPLVAQAPRKPLVYWIRADSEEECHVLNHLCHILQHLGVSLGVSQLVLPGVKTFTGNRIQYGVAKGQQGAFKRFLTETRESRRQTKNSLCAGQNPKISALCLKMTHANSVGSNCKYKDEAVCTLTELPN